MRSDDSGLIGGRSGPDIERTLRAIVGGSGVLVGSGVDQRSCDPLRQRPILAPLIVRPANTSELADVVSACAERRQTMVVLGGLTGVAGGAYSTENDIAISLERMARIEEIDTAGQTATVQGGVPLAALQTAAAEDRLMYPIDLSSQGSATVGGTIATNAGGNRVVRWGMTRRHVLGLEVVGANGSVLQMLNRLVKNNTGYDIKQLFIGSEGTLGIISKAVLQLVALPTSQSVMLLALESFEKVSTLLSHARRLSSLSAFEVMWRDYYEMMASSGTGRDPLPIGYEFYVLVETLGYNDARDRSAAEEFLQQVWNIGLVADASIASSTRQGQELWRVREGSEVLIANMSPFVSFDISIDLRHVDLCVKQIKAALAGKFEGCSVVTFGHLGDNNIHMGVHAGPKTLEVESSIEETVFSELAEFGGSISAEHGIGVLKREFLHLCKSPKEIAVMRQLKASFDPDGLLNPAVLFPRSSA